MGRCLAVGLPHALPSAPQSPGLQVSPCWFWVSQLGVLQAAEAARFLLPSASEAAAELMRLRSRDMSNIHADSDHMVRISLLSARVHPPQ